jgi:putative membrane protein
MMGFDGFGMMLWGSLVMILFWGGLILLAVWAIRAFGQPRPSSDSPLDILKHRLASGEISQEEYKKTRRVLLG